jgi:hypothetical protein
MILIHQKPFSVTLDFPDAKRALVYYNHGILLDRSWWNVRKILRKWRFLRIPNEFESIANAYSKNIHCFIWESGKIFPKKKNISLEIQVLDFKQRSFETRELRFSIMEKQKPDLISKIQLNKINLSYSKKVNFSTYREINIHIEEPNLKK